MSLADSYLTAGQEVTITTMGASNTYGEAAAGATATVRTRFRKRIRLVRTALGEEIQSVAEFMVNPSVAVAVDDKVAQGGTTYPVVAVEPAYGLGGEVLHKMVYLGI